MNFILKIIKLVLGTTILTITTIKIGILLEILYPCFGYFFSNSTFGFKSDTHNYNFYLYNYLMDHTIIQNEFYNFVQSIPALNEEYITPTNAKETITKTASIYNSYLIYSLGCTMTMFIGSGIVAALYIKNLI